MYQSALKATADRKQDRTQFSGLKYSAADDGDGKSFSYHPAVSTLVPCLLSETFAVLFMVAVFEPQLTSSNKAGLSQDASQLQRFSPAFGVSVTAIDETLYCGARIAMSSVTVDSRLHVNIGHSNVS